jgi:hypothetical protein
MNNEFEWAAKDFTQGQLNAMVKKLVEAAGKDAPQKLLRDELIISVRKILGGLSAPSEPITVGPLTKIFKPKEFFRDDNADVKLYVWDNFKDRILASTGNVSKKPAVEIVSRDITKAMNDSEICAELAENYVFRLDDLWIIAELLRCQPKGKNGALLNNGYANLFYIQVAPALVLVFCMYWGGSTWDVDAWGLDEYGRWGGGPRVFSRNG